IALFAAIGFVVFQRNGIQVAEYLISHIAKPWAHNLAGLPGMVQQQIREIYRRRRALWLAGGMHFIAWLASCLQAWIALHFMGINMDLASVLAIESLLYAVRSIAFAVPNAVGVQEAAYVLLGAAFQLPPEAALALSL